jgi:Family of unknown function (DUF6526)
MIIFWDNHIQMPQNYRNHTRLSTSYHFVTLPAILALLAGSIINLINSSDDNLYSASLICLIAIILVSMFFHSRIFGLKAQDRAIRAEENLRHFMLTSRPLDSRLRLGQIIALRFAPDDEVVALAKRAAEEKLSARDIKKSIRNWKPDEHRV